MPAPPDLINTARFKFWVEEHVRFSDLDSLGHVNNNAFGIYFESGRVAFMIGVGLRAGPTDPAVVVARLEIDYRAELHYPAKLDVGVAVERLGQSSITLACGLFQGETCYATSRAVMVRLDKATRRATLLLPDERALFTPYLLQQD